MLVHLALFFAVLFSFSSESDRFVPLAALLDELDKSLLDPNSLRGNTDLLMLESNAYIGEQINLQNTVKEICGFGEVSLINGGDFRGRYLFNLKNTTFSVRNVAVPKNLTTPIAHVNKKSVLNITNMALVGTKLLPYLFDVDGGHMNVFNSSLSGAQPFNTLISESRWGSQSSFDGLKADSILITGSNPLFSGKYMTVKKLQFNNVTQQSFDFSNPEKKYMDTITLSDSNFTNCQDVISGAIFSPANTRLFQSSNTTFVRTEKTYNQRSTHRFTTSYYNAVFDSCQSLEQGGAVYMHGYIKGNSLSFRNCKFMACMSHTSMGGAVYYSGGNWNVSVSTLSCTFNDCYADKDGGAIYLYEGYFYFGGSNFTNCSTSDYTDNSGGAICLNSIYTLYKGYTYNCIFTSCRSSYAGAVSCVTFEDNYYCLHCSFRKCEATYGGALYLEQSRKHSYLRNVSYCAFTNNTATYGNDIYLSGSPAGTNSLSSCYTNSPEGLSISKDSNPVIDMMRYVDSPDTRTGFDPSLKPWGGWSRFMPGYTAIIVSIVLGVVVGIILIIVLIICCCRWRHGKSSCFTCCSCCRSSSSSYSYPSTTRNTTSNAETKETEPTPEQKEEESAYAAEQAAAIEAQMYSTPYTAGYAQPADSYMSEQYASPDAGTAYPAEGAAHPETASYSVANPVYSAGPAAYPAEKA